MENIKLTKNDILKGKDQVHTRHFERLGGELTLRPLTEGEWAEVEAIQVSAVKMVAKPVYSARGELDRQATEKNLEMEIDPGRVQQLEFEAKALAVAYALTTADEIWTIKEVKQLRPIGIIAEIAEFVYHISGISKEAAEQVTTFRAEQGRADHSTAAHSRNPVYKTDAGEFDAGTD